HPGGVPPERGKRVPPPTNSRSGQARERHARVGRSTLAAWLARFRLLTGIIVVISASVLVAWGLRRYLRSSPRFAIKTVLVDGNQRRTAHQITKRAGIAVGDNIFVLDPQAAAAEVQADEWIEHAEVHRDLPNAVRIEVTEREARAVASIDGTLVLVDAKGTLFKRVKRGDPTDFAMVTGIEADAVAGDRAGVTERLRRVLDLVADLERVGIARRYPIQEVHLEPDDRIVVTVGSDGIALAMGQPPYRTKVERADRILVEVARRKAKPSVVFLDDEARPERVVVRMQ
ncbi:MAG: FtsQ-type POTRA domain-containing protein, partial [Deltaproteobacteria bacterium]|nr:FtsQ-type POTRA domain-containing protein [Deltaproteobacteria bacterium]MBW2533529.1 FtsQ-type POTRA domain-containing protein [Deltaproteobacteria bacterium]